MLLHPIGLRKPVMVRVALKSPEAKDWQNCVGPGGRTVSLLRMAPSLIDLPTNLHRGVACQTSRRFLDIATHSSAGALILVVVPV